VTLEREARPGKPRDVGVHGPVTWFVDHDDGTVSFVVRRTEPSGLRHGSEFAFHAATDEEALREHEAWSRVQLDRVERTAARMSRWGPMGTGRMT
jgi:hypothetical protein